MSQPPQPPQPPGGQPSPVPPPPPGPPPLPPEAPQDYGYPQDPQAQPYGYPQQPQAQPYGYPQPPQAQPDYTYGYPQQPAPYGQPDPANPYGQPAAPGAQNPYAQPPAADPNNPYAQQPAPGDPNAYAQQPRQAYDYQQGQQGQQGWGAPAAPAAPGMPGADAAAANPYADPQQQAYQQAPYAQPSYPTVPPTGPAGPTGPAKGGRGGAGGPSNGKLIGLIAGVLGVVVVVGVGVWLLTSGGSSDTQAKGGGGGTSSAPHNAQGKLQWSVPAPKVSKSQLIGDTPGMWFSGSDVIKQSTTDVTAYDLASGRKDWTVPTPAGHTCDAAEGIADNRIAVQYGSRCENIMAIEAPTGKLLWHKPLPSSSSSKYEFTDTDMAISGDTVAVTWDDHTVSFKADSGASGWHSSGGDNCQDAGFAGGSQMIEVYKCGYDENPPYHASLIDPSTGKPKWTWDAPAGTKITNVISVNPVVVGIGAGSDLITDVWDIDGGHLQGKISLGKGSYGQGKYGIDCPAIQMTPCRDVAVSGNTLYMATYQHPASGGADGLTDAIAAFNLTDGSSKWLTKDGQQMMDVVAVDGDSLVAYQEPTFEDPGAIIKVDSATGAMTTYTSFVTSTQAKEHDAYGPGVSHLAEGWHNDTLAVSLTEITDDGFYPDLMAVLH
jgi:PQQ-like domain